MTDPQDPRLQQIPPENLKTGPVMIIYILYLVGFVIGFTALVGVIMAHFKIGEADAAARSHYRYQIRTFWFGLLTMIVGGLLMFVLVGYLVLIWMAIWVLVRCIKGILRALDNRPLENPATLLW